MGCTIQKKVREKHVNSQQQLSIATQEVQKKQSSPKIENMTIETPSQLNLRAQRLKDVRHILLNGYPNSPKSKISRKESGQISQIEQRRI
ncbi:unnamed protein product (macronuclear) [Paramecium tetraurelia]|uniref:Uncharacterized protein n=1 Tax=Paramecium tetraurelia TaxID=5888 RepID=A0DTY8_PARTE|nr:uncharacterized protein GSPATT00020189001 [Paramecium tetraurelia]CAK86505.1 unnamed protein product [Paramecium tetraurelia]|eukprot:XP_001453902.1 hypothetical protein (macronuclear) [Paramecium tetraurelia strain d4-2]